MRQLLRKLDVNLRARIGVLAKLVRDDGLERVAVRVVVPSLLEVHFDALGVRAGIVRVVFGDEVLLREFEIDIAAFLHGNDRQQLLRDESFVAVGDADVRQRLVYVERVECGHVSSSGKWLVASGERQARSSACHYPLATRNCF